LDILLSFRWNFLDLPGGAKREVFVFNHTLLPDPARATTYAAKK
jgi:hypothetical protein